jgi:hypothetical protein
MITYSAALRRPLPEEFLYYAGTTFTVEWYYTMSAEMPAREHYLGMDEVDQMRLDHMVKYVADKPFGTLLPRTLYRIEDREHKIYAFKPRDERFFNFTTAGKKIIITNCYRKHSPKMGKGDLEKLAYAIRCRQDYLRRVREGIYYED